MKGVTFLFIILCAKISSGAIWYVGSSRMYTLPSQVKSLVQDGDTVFIDGGVYSNDATKWDKKNLVIVGLGTNANRTILQYGGDIPNGKGIFVFESPGVCDNAFIENIVFDGAQVSDANGGNGAGIRFQANNLTVNNCKFTNCQNGILEGNAAVSSSNVTILNSEFFNNGYQLQNDPTYSGYEHNIYISASTDTLLVENCYFHHPRGQGNSIKTRAQRAFILYNFIDEEATGYGSWEINIAQGGLNVVIGNVIIQGESGANHGMIGYDAVVNSIEDFYFVNNTVINRFAGNIKYFNVLPTNGINTFKIYNNIFASVPGANNTMISGAIPSVLDSSNNFFAGNYLTLGFANLAIGDYNLTAISTMLIDQGANAGITSTGFSLTPINQFAGFDLPLQMRSNAGTAIDIGAYEYPGAVFIENNSLERLIVFPNPSNGIFNLELTEKMKAGDWLLDLFNLQGELILQRAIDPMQKQIILDLSNYSSGIYFLELKSDNKILSKKLILNDH